MDGAQWQSTTLLTHAMNAPPSPAITYQQHHRMAFTDLVNAVVASFITPLIAAIFRGVSFEVMSD